MPKENRLVENRMQKLRTLPAIDRLLAAAGERSEFRGLPRQVLVKVLRQVGEMVRYQLKAGNDADVSTESLLNLARLAAAQETKRSLRRVINVTGVPLHTNLGRAPLSNRAIAAVNDIMLGYSTLEYHVETGERGSRYSHVVKRLCELTGAEDALVVNNNAAAVLLALSALAGKKEVIVSRGQLVEIGGSFRIPDVMQQSGAKLVEVGTTNKTHLTDYKQAITENTALILKVHTSNYRIVGFTSQPDDTELVAMAHEHGLVAMDDLGSGTLLPLQAGGWREPSVTERIDAGYDVVTFSGDKLLGGGQAGIVAGKKKYISQMKQHPLTRAVRIDKLSLAALEGTLLDYQQGDPLHDIPVQRMLHASQEYLQDQASLLANELAYLQTYGWRVTVRPVVSTAGGGSLPAVDLPGWGVAVKPRLYSASTVEGLLRRYVVPIITRIQDDEILFDIRTLQAAEQKEIAAALQEIAQGEGK